MPNWKTHIAVSFVFCSALFLLLGLTLRQMGFSVLLLAFSSILPDLDHPKSVIRETVAILGAFFAAVFVLDFLKFEPAKTLIVLVFVWIAVYFGVKKLPLRHRGRKSLHKWRLAIYSTIFFAVIFWLVNINIIFSIFVLFGYSTHLALDRIKRV